MSPVPVTRKVIPDIKERKEPNPKMDHNQLAFTTSSATSAGGTTAIIVLCSQLMLQW